MPGPIPDPGKIRGVQIMPVMDEFKEEREAIKHAPFAKKLEYFKDYYLLPLIIVLVTAGIAGSFFYSVFSQKKAALYVSLVNFNLTEESTDGLTAPFAEERINPRREEIFLDYSSFISSDENELNFIKYGYEDEQRLFSMVMTGTIDLFITGEDVIDRYAEQDWFDDLRTVYDETLLAKLEREGRIKYRNGVPIAVNISDSELLKRYFYYNGKAEEEIYAGFPAGGQHRTLAVQFVQYLTGQE